MHKCTFENVDIFIYVGQSKQSMSTVCEVIEAAHINLKNSLFSFFLEILYGYSRNSSLLGFEFSSD